MRHIISVLLENEPGALSRVAGLFSARGYNIESLTVAPTHDATLSRMTIVTIGDDRKVDQIEKQLNKLVDVAAMHDITVDRHLERELVLIKLSMAEDNMTELNNVLAAANASIIDTSDKQCLIEMTGHGQQVDDLVKKLGAFNIIEVARSGITGLALGERSLTI